VIRFLSLGKAAHGKEIEEADVVAWANGGGAGGSMGGGQRGRGAALAQGRAALCR